ncbi:MAG: PRTRC system protein A [Azoarcus sp.]|jgi:PRTRC genetic system protein A|nr:PRTRC system protein A [Azoarcus sp.]
MDVRDLALQATCPVIAAPRFGDLPPMKNGQRIVLGANGVFVQVRLDWLDCIQALMFDAPAMRLPYGYVQERLAFSFGVLPMRLIEAFVVAARAQLPDEVAGALIYSRRSGKLRLAILETLHASPVRVHYRLPKLADDETVAVDLHSHGHGAPFWSVDDDRDDMGIKIAGVFGKLHLPRPHACFRLAINGLFRPLPHPWQDEPPGRRRGASEETTSLETSFFASILDKWHGIRHR